MGWEYRIFFRPDPSTPSLLNLKGKTEERTDVYYVHSPGVGVKQRGGGGGLEVKFLKDSDEYGFEKWDKYKTNDDDIDTLLQQHRRAPLPIDVPPISLIKRRVQSNFGFKVLEETDIVLCFSEPGEEPIQEQWRTVCIEGKRKHCLPQQQELLGQVQALIGYDHNNNIMVGGYALFIAHAVARLWSDPSGRAFIKGAGPVPPPPSNPYNRSAEDDDATVGCGFDVFLGGSSCNK